MDRYLEPTYLEADFNTSAQKLRELMERSDTFKDYNYEGSNISMLIELFAFLNDNSTYFINKSVKNIYPESAEVYETVHSISSIRGYHPKGYIAPNLNLNVKVLVDQEEENLPSPGEQLFIPAWFRINTGMESADGDSITYMTTKDYTIDIPSDLEYGEFDFTIPMKQGTFEVLEFSGQDIVDNKLILPFIDFDYDLPPYDENPGMILYVNGNPWTRTDEFLHSMLDSNDELYRFEFDKYQRYNIVFSPAFKVPDGNDRIVIIANNTLGIEGNVYSGLVNDFNEIREVPVLEENDIVLESQRFLQNISRDMEINKDFIEITNPDPSFNASLPETIEEIKRNSRSAMYSQNRNATPRDYREHLVEHPDVVAGNAWGESEINPQNTEEYNRVYVSVIPREFNDGTITYEDNTWNRSEVEQYDEIIKPLSYNPSFSESLYKHLESRKLLGAFETLKVPSLVYFAFDIGLVIKRSYNFVNVREDLKRKLSLYFDKRDQEFNTVIDFKKLQNFILDLTIRDKMNRRFSHIRGIESVTFRDILTYTPESDTPELIYEPNDELDYPMFTESTFEQDYDNVLRPIKLGLNQFPVLSLNNSVFINEK